MAKKLNKKLVTVDEAIEILDQTNRLLKPLAVICNQIDTNLAFLQSLTLDRQMREDLCDFIKAVAEMADQHSTNIAHRQKNYYKKEEMN